MRLSLRTCFTTNQCTRSLNEMCKQSLRIIVTQLSREAQVWATAAFGCRHLRYGAAA